MLRKRRERRSFTSEFKADAVKLVKDSGKSIGQIAKDLDLTETALREWVKRAEGGSIRSKLSSDEREELERLRRENRTCVFRPWRSGVSEHRDRANRRIAIGAKRRCLVSVQTPV
jgi:transposase